MIGQGDRPDLSSGLGCTVLFGVGAVSELWGRVKACCQRYLCLPTADAAGPVSFRGRPGFDPACRASRGRIAGRG